MSMPLVINKATGKKFGKSEDGAVWLDAHKTSVYKFYQFWLNCDDEGVIDYIKIYTLLSKEQIEDIERQFNEDRAGRLAQRTLAYEVTKLVHGEARAESVKRISEVLFGGGEYTQLTVEDFAQLAGELPTVKVRLGETTLVQALLEARLAGSNGEARRFLESNAVYINGQQVPAGKTQFDEHDNIHSHAIMRRGKNSSAVIYFV